jgi:hypothetical protein
VLHTSPSKIASLVPTSGFSATALSSLWHAHLLPILSLPSLENA